MGQRELLLTIGAIVIFSLGTFSINQNLAEATDSMVQQQVAFYASSIAQRFIEEAKTKAFDELTINNSVSTPLGFALSGSGGGETYPNFDDVDDFLDVPATVNTPVGPMTVSVTMHFVNSGDLNTPAGTPTYYKRMTVVVNSSYLDSPVTMRYVFAYQKN